MPLAMGKGKCSRSHYSCGCSLFSSTPDALGRKQGHLRLSELAFAENKRFALTSASKVPMMAGR